METVLVTGGAGYLGSLLVPNLLNDGYKVKVLEKFMWGVGPLLPVAAHKNLEIIKGDVRDESTLKSSMKGCDSIVNLAAIVGYPACLENPQVARETNLDAVGLIAKNLSSDQKFIHASTGSTYGQVDDICTEDTPINPLTLYGETKAEAEKHVLDNNGVALRFATVFGSSPRLRLDLLVNDITYQVVHYKTFVMYEGHARRTFLHSSDAARSVQFSLENYSTMSGKPYNVGDEELNYTKSEVAELIKKKFDYYLHFAEFGEDKDKRDYAVSYKRLNDLGFKAKVNMNDGLDELLRVLPHVQEKSIYRNV